MSGEFVVDDVVKCTHRPRTGMYTWGEECGKLCIPVPDAEYRSLYGSPEYVCDEHLCSCHHPSEMSPREVQCRVCNHWCCARCSSGCNCNDDGYAMDESFMPRYVYQPDVDYKAIVKKNPNICNMFRKLSLKKMKNSVNG